MTLLIPSNYTSRNGRKTVLVIRYDDGFQRIHLPHSHDILASFSNGVSIRARRDRHPTYIDQLVRCRIERQLTPPCKTGEHSSQTDLDLVPVLSASACVNVLRFFCVGQIHSTGSVDKDACTKTVHQYLRRTIECAAKRIREIRTREIATGLYEQRVELRVHVQRAA